jgi:translocator protein
MRINNFAKLIISILICLGAAFIGSAFTTPSIASWYSTLQKPSFTPPNWLFAPAWTILFIMMGIALSLIWQKGFKKNTALKAKKAIIIFFIQLALNVAWSFLFFYWHSPFWALIDIIVLWAFILLTLIKFWEINKTAGGLLIPYLAWVTFASSLNFAVYRLN